MLRRLHVPLRRPEDVQPHLGDPELHWKAGFSAQELAYCWHMAALDIPPAVRATLNTVDDFRKAELIDGFFEREVKLNTSRANSQTDLMLVLGLPSELVIVAVEGKVDESFDKLVSEWDTSESRHDRLVFLADKLGLDVASITHLRYQLLHRTYSAISEAHRYRARKAVMLVHSFSESHSWFEDFQRLGEALGIPLEQRNVCSAPTICDGIELRLAWTSDVPVQRKSDVPSGGTIT